VKIYLLLIDDEQFFFYSDESEAAREQVVDGIPAERAASGLAGWLHVRLNRFKMAWHDRRFGVTSWLRRAWDWLHSWSHPDEWMLSQLRTAKIIELHHPTSQTGDEVLAIWQNYVSRQTNRHLVWLAINGAAAPFSIVFAILPGPNVIGYWFLYRAIHHLLIVWGTIRVRRGRVPVSLHPRNALDIPVERDLEGRTTHAAIAGTGERLDQHVARSRASPRTQDRKRSNRPR
jgi:hypothetical protein